MYLIVFNYCFKLVILGYCEYHRNLPVQYSKVKGHTNLMSAFTLSLLSSTPHIIKLITTLQKYLK